MKIHIKKEHIHFVGIGGIGMSALAHIARKQGHIVSGCDTTIEQPTIENLKQQGCTIVSPNGHAHCFDSSITLYIYSTVLPQESPEFIHARTHNITLLHRSELLAHFMKEKTSIAVAGSHGKTTTSSLLSHIFLSAQKDPTIIIGGMLQSLQSNARYGTSEFLIAEADESDRSLLNLHYNTAIITNIDLDHLETYKNLADLQQTMLRFMHKAKQTDTLIVCSDSPHATELLSALTTPVYTYGYSAEADYTINNYTESATESSFTITHTTHSWNITLSMPGTCNSLNATAAFITAYHHGIKPETAIQALATFTGVERRFTKYTAHNGALLVDDYGHHPTEIAHALAIAQQQNKKRIRVLFQPHRYSRTKALWREFIELFAKSNIDELIITDIYPSSEAPLEGITSQALLQKLTEAKVSYTLSYIPLDNNFQTLRQYIQNTIQSEELLLFQGAGKINKLIKSLL